MTGQAVMQITPEAVLQVAQVAILTGIFFRLGRHGAEIEGVKHRVERIETTVKKGA